MANIGYKIFTRRKELGLTQEEVGRKIGVTKATVNRYEKGVVTKFTRSRIEQLAEALEVSPLWLLGFDSIGQAQAEAIYSSLGAFQEQKGISPIDTRPSDYTEELLRLWGGFNIKKKLALLTRAYELEENKDVD